MAVPQNKSEFIEYCLRKLGSPVIKINVAAEQIDDRVDEALYRFHERHYLGVESIYAIFRFSKEDCRKGYVVLPPDIVGVSDVFHASNTSNIYSVDFLMRLGEIQAMSKTDFAGINYYYTVKMHLELLQEMFNPDPQFNYNRLSNRLIIAGGVKNLAFTEGVMVLRAYRKITDKQNDGPYNRIKDQEYVGRTPPNAGLDDRGVSTDTEVKVNIWQERWLQNYATSLIKMQWAENMGKYANISLLGGVTLNAADMKQEAAKEIEELERQLNDDYSEPVIGFWG